MIQIANNGIITMTAGDDFKYPLFINAGTIDYPLRYILTENDKICFSIKESGQPFECAIVRKIFTAEDLNCFGDVVITLANSDTECLVDGPYYYEIRLLHHTPERDYSSTIVSNKRIYIL